MNLHYNIIMTMKHQVLGILAHVDAGKTTLSESFLYASQTIRTKGRVDHQNTYLDYDRQERDRGITIYSKQARFQWKECRFILIDTPGHIDFSSEMEKTLQVLDIAVLVINGCDGVQSHTETIWKLLDYYQIPVFVFVNKMDISHKGKKNLLDDLKKLDERIVDVTDSLDEIKEMIAMMNDEKLNRFMNQELDEEDIREGILSRSAIPCIFGSALKEQKVTLLLDWLATFTIQKKYPSEFGGKVFKITHEDKQRWVHLKITGGNLCVKDKVGVDKIDQIRLYSGERYESVQSAKAGEIVSVSGLDHVKIFDGVGNEKHQSLPMLESYMEYRMLLPKDCDALSMMKKLTSLIEEEPQMHIRYDEIRKDIHLQLMGEVQIEILKKVILERFGVAVEFDEGTILYKETITSEVEGIGHFEPLRHYAEVHLFMEPLPRNSGLIFDNKCSEEMLAGNWQRLILHHLQEKKHVGVLSGSLITDMKITLISGKGHLKHTEGGDFREAALRAVRQGLRSTKCILLEPYFSYTLVLPANYLSRAIYDIESRQGTFSIEENQEDFCVLTGKAPVRTFRNYQFDVLNYTKGQGRLSFFLSGYEPCKDEEIIQEIGYDCERDTENPCGSIFCKNGAGFYVPYDQVEQYMHIKKIKNKSAGYESYVRHKIDDEEVLRVYERTYGAAKTRLPKRTDISEEKVEIKENKTLKKCLLIDGYNVIHAWEDLASIAADHLDAARDRLIDIMSSYQGYQKCLLILVFDAYKVKGQMGSMFYNGSIYITYTKTAQTADSYIEKATHELKNDYSVSVVTSDALEQLIISGQGAMRISAREFEKEVMFSFKRNMQEYENKMSKSGHRMLENLRKLNDL